MNKQSSESNFFEFLKNQKWLMPVLIVVFLLLLGSMIFLSEEINIAPVIYSKF
jgi:cell division protein FtsL